MHVVSEWPTVQVYPVAVVYPVPNLRRTAIVHTSSVATACQQEFLFTATADMVCIRQFRYEFCSSVVRVYHPPSLHCIPYHQVYIQTFLGAGKINIHHFAELIVFAHAKLSVHFPHVLYKFAYGKRHKVSMDVKHIQFAH